VQPPRTFAEYLQLTLEMARARVRAEFELVQAEFDLVPFGCRIIGTTDRGIPQPVAVVLCYDAALRPKLLKDAAAVGVVDPAPRHLATGLFTVAARD